MAGPQHATLTRAITLTDALVRRLTSEGRTERTVADALRPGLLLRLRASGAKSWLGRRTGDGRQRRETIGAPPAMTVAEAREAATRLLLGEDAATPAPASRSSAPLFRDFAAAYRACRARVWKPSTLYHFDAILRAHLMPRFGATRLDALDAASVADWFHTLSRTAPGGANRTLDALRAMLNDARATGALSPDAPDPSASIRRNRPGRPGRTLTLAELGRLGAALDALGETFPAETKLIRLILLTGCRPGEVFRLRWIAVGAASLRVDGKTGPRTVALSAPASALLDDKRRGKGRGYVFPTLLRRDGTPRRSIARCWAAVRERAALPADLRLHDLRHTYASQASVAEEPRFLVSRLLGHRALSSTSRYTHLHDEEALAAAERVSSAVASLMARG